MSNYTLVNQDDTLAEKQVDGYGQFDDINGLQDSEEQSRQRTHWLSLTLIVFLAFAVNLACLLFTTQHVRATRDELRLRVDFRDTRVLPRPDPYLGLGLGKSY